MLLPRGAELLTGERIQAPVACSALLFGVDLLGELLGAMDSNK
jgi:hypothetical protein